MLPALLYAPRHHGKRVDFEVAQGMDPMCAYNLWTLKAVLLLHSYST